MPPRKPELERIYEMITSLKRVADDEAEFRRVASALKTLSKGLTRERSLAGTHYLSDPHLMEAYLRHFWLVSYAEASLCLSVIDRLGRPVAPSPADRALDLGAGPGPLSLALLERGWSSVTAVDRSKQALSVARELARRSGRKLETKVTKLEVVGSLPTGPWQIITLGHVLNELWPGHSQRLDLVDDLVRRLADMLVPGGRMVIIEPALMETAQDAIRARDTLVSCGMVVEYPCTRQGRCPALPGATCHSEFAWSPPKRFTRLAHAARIGRDSLKTSCFILRKTHASGATGRPVETPVSLQHEAARENPASTLPSVATPDGLVHRVVSEAMVSKGGRIRCLVCGPCGRFPISAPVDSAQAVMIRRLTRGDAIIFTGTETRETGRGLEERSRVEFVERASAVSPSP